MSSPLTIASNPAWNATTPASEVAAALSPSIAGKTILVTGVLPGGLGAHFVKVVAAHRPRLLILADRGGPPLAAYAAELQAAHPEVAVRTLEVDLGSFARIRSAAAELLAWPELNGRGGDSGNGGGKGGIDVLVTNAGVMSPTYQTTADGLELHFGVNYVGHFLFVNLVMPKLLESRAGARVVNVSSNGHRSSDIRWDDLNFQDGKAYHMWRAYGQSKTALILFSVELARRLGPKGLKAFSLHPGSIWTNLSRFNSDEDWARLKALDRELGNKQGAPDYKMDLKDVSQGTATHVVAAFDPQVDERYNGAYLLDCQLAPAIDLKPYAVDKESAARLWTLTEQLVGQSFDY